MKQAHLIFIPYIILLILIILLVFSKDKLSLDMHSVAVSFGNN